MRSLILIPIIGVVGLLYYLFSPDLSSASSQDQKNIIDKKTPLTENQFDEDSSFKKYQSKHLKKISNYKAIRKVNSLNSKTSTTSPSNEKAKHANTDSVIYANDSEDDFYEISEDERKTLFKRGYPQTIHITRNGVAHEYSHPNGEGTGAGKDKVLRIADSDTINSHSKARNLAFKNSQTGEESTCANDLKVRSNAYIDESFIPGLMDGRFKGRTIPRPTNLLRRILFVDFDLGLHAKSKHIKNNSNTLPAKISKDLSDLTLSFGHGGELIIETTNSYITNGPGADFRIYENAFLIEKGNKGAGTYYYEIGEVGVSSNNSHYFWFNCNKYAPYSPESHCAGKLPTSKGGDGFDLSELKSYNGEKIRFIKIRDTGNNFQAKRATAAGLDLDGVKLINKCAQ